MNVLESEYSTVWYAFYEINTSVSSVAGSCLLVVLSSIAQLGDAQRVILNLRMCFGSFSGSLLFFEQNGFVPGLYVSE